MHEYYGRSVARPLARICGCQAANDAKPRLITARRSNVRSPHRVDSARRLRHVSYAFALALPPLNGLWPR
jgi:hypothetical protein